MKASDLVAVLNKVIQMAGDMPVVLKHVEQDVETDLRSLVVRLDPTSGQASGKVVIEHAPTPVSPAAPSVVAPGDAPAGQPGGLS